MSEVKPWKVVIVPDGSVKILDELGTEVRHYPSLRDVAEGLAKGLRTMRRLRGCSWPQRENTFKAVLQFANPVLIEDERAEDMP